MRLSLKISHKGLLLVLIPVFFQLVFVSVLIQQLNQAEQDLQNEIRSKDIVYTTSMIGRNFAESVAFASAYSTTESLFFKRHYMVTRKNFFRNFGHLETLLQTPDKRDQQERVKKAKKIAREGRDLLDKIVAASDQKRKGEEMGFIFRGPLAVTTAKRFVDDLARELSFVMRHEKALADSYINTSARSRRNVQYLLMAFVGIGICTAFSLAIFFARSITRRIEAVIANTHRVPKGEQLTPPIGGTDEIAELDLVFHRMVDELYKAQEMKEYLLSMVSHDLRSPLTSVRGVLTLMSAGALGEISDKAKQRVAAAESEVTRLINMTNDLLDVERLASGKLDMDAGPVPAAQILEESVGAMGTLAEQHEVELVQEPATFTVIADRDRILQVMVNLISNSIKYSPARGKVRLRADRDGEEAVFQVIDEGRGIPKDFQQKIFERFQQVEEADSREKGGKGLGLAICKSIIDAHGGRIGVDSEPGKGSTFWFRLPLAPETVSDESL